MTGNAHLYREAFDAGAAAFRRRERASEVNPYRVTGGDFKRSALSRCWLAGYRSQIAPPPD